MKLTEKQKRFADYYIETGNGSESYKRVYKSCKKDETARANSSRLLTNDNVREYIQERNTQLEDDRIADMKEVKRFWTDTLRTQENDYKDRLKASEYIAKTNGAFLEKVEHSGGLDIKVSLPQELSEDGEN
ncbi:MAG: terminase small subunit [Balneolales bacterium]